MPLGALVVGLQQDVVEEDRHGLGGGDVALDRGEAQREEELFAGAVAQLLDAAARAVGGDRDEDVLVAFVDVGLQPRVALAGQGGEERVGARQQRALVGRAIAGDRVAQDALGEAGAGVALGQLLDLGLQARLGLRGLRRLLGALQACELVAGAGQRLAGLVALRRGARRPAPSAPRRAPAARRRRVPRDGLGDLGGGRAPGTGELAVELARSRRAAPRPGGSLARAGRSSASSAAPAAARSATSSSSASATIAAASACSVFERGQLGGQRLALGRGGAGLGGTAMQDRGRRGRGPLGEIGRRSGGDQLGDRGLEGAAAGVDRVDVGGERVEALLIARGLLDRAQRAERPVGLERVGQAAVGAQRAPTPPATPPAALRRRPTMTSAARACRLPAATASATRPARSASPRSASSRASAS